MIGDCGILSPS